MSEENDVSPTDILRLLGPYLAASAVATAVLVLSVQRFVPIASPVVTVSVVSFDVLKYTNSQRAVASSFIRAGADITVANELLLNLPTRTRSAIRDIAGPGTLVVVKQAVVQGQTTDITDAVLTELGLPLNVPTSDAAAYSLDVAPTNLFGMPRGPTREPEPTPRGPIALP